jgi:alpha-beta hydrolase superfamily lysophospholipase
MATDTTSTVRTRDGLALSIRHQIPSSPRARVVLLHGYAEHNGRYAGLTAALTGAGYECHAPDLRGHGLSEGVRGHVLRFEDYLDDVDLILENLPGDGGLPRFLIGHSLGGLISLACVLRRPEAFGVLAVSSPFLFPAMPVPWLKETLATAASYLAPTLLLDSEIDPRGLSHDPVEVEAYVADPLVFKTVNPRWFFEVRKAQDGILERAAEIVLPTLFLLGGADPIAQPERGRQVFERLGSLDKRLVVYEGLFHEVLNEVERGRVLDDLLGWLGERIRGSSSLPSAPSPGR